MGHLSLVGIPPSIFSAVQQQRKSCSTHYDPTAKREKRPESLQSLRPSPSPPHADFQFCLTSYNFGSQKGKEEEGDSELQRIPLIRDIVEFILVTVQSRHQEESSINKLLGQLGICVPYNRYRVQVSPTSERERRSMGRKFSLA